VALRIVDYLYAFQQMPTGTGSIHMAVAESTQPDVADRRAIAWLVALRGLRPSRYHDVGQP
jgi:hypothetical protein